MAVAPALRLTSRTWRTAGFFVRFVYCGKGRALGLAPQSHEHRRLPRIAVDAVVGRTFAQRTVATKTSAPVCAEHRHPHANLVLEPLLAKSIAAGRHARAALNPVSREGATPRRLRSLSIHQ